VTERWRVRLPVGPLPSNNSGQVIHTYVPVWLLIV